MQYIFTTCFLLFGSFYSKPYGGQHIPCSADVEKLKKQILHNPFILTLPEVGDVKDDIIPKNVQQFWVITLLSHGPQRNYRADELSPFSILLCNIKL